MRFAIKQTRFPRWLRWILGIFTLLIALMAAFFIYNQFDEKLDPTTQAWLAFQTAPVVAAKENGYLALYSLESEAPDRLAVAASTIAKLQQIAHSPLSDNDRAREYQYALAALKIKPRSYTEWSEVCPRDKPCLSTLQAQQPQLSQLRHQHAELLARYTDMLAMPAFNDLFIPDLVSGPIANYSPANKIGTLYLSTITPLLKAQQYQAAWQQWAHYQQFWLRAAQGSNSLIHLMFSIGQLQRGNLILTEILTAYPESKIAAQKLALPVLQSDQSLRAVFYQSILGEFRLTAEAMSSLKSMSAANSQSLLGEESYLTFLGASTFQVNATLNLTREIWARNFSNWQTKWSGFELGPVPRSDPCENPNYLANPVGKIIACIAGPDYEKYLVKVIRVEQASKELAQRLALE